METNRIKGYIKEYSTLIALIVIIIVASFAFENFCSLNNFSNLFKQASMIGVMAIGGSFVILTGGIDLSVGSQCGFASVIAGYIGAATGNAALMVIGAIITCAAWGALNGFCITKLRVQPFIVTLAMMSGISGVGLLITEGGNSVSIVLESFRAIGIESVVFIPIPAIIMICAFILAALAAKYTVFGRNCYAIGGNEDAAVMKGIPVDKTKFFTYVLSGACAGLAGVILAARTYSGNILLGEGYEMDVIASVVLGGTLLSGGRGKVLNSMWGALIITIIGNIINLNKDIPYQWEGCVTGGVLLIILIIQSRMTKSEKQLCC
ncbi:ABC transporter permease [Christensenella timonensis]|uniref:ABC transporter permease n=1 Tax=Christensenella timonensis TaxID=1816678 RepID=UPI00082F5C64|nr:ABC transporter permease [Christensenella timonensis]